MSVTKKIGKGVIKVLDSRIKSKERTIEELQKRENSLKRDVSKLKMKRKAVKLLTK